jgi:esterase
MELFYREAGEGEPIILLHGIFGSSDNWLTQAKLLSAHYHTYALDMRNHGQSFHDPEFDYPSMVNDVFEFMETHGIKNPIMMGHSMGGKVAMNFAVAHADKLQKLVVVDIAPKAYDMKHYIILDGLKAIPIAKITTRDEADDALAPFVEEPDVRQFLLKNIQRKPDGSFRWKLNLKISASIFSFKANFNVQHCL